MNTFVTNNAQNSTITDRVFSHFCEDYYGNPNVDHPLTVTHRLHGDLPPLNGRWTNPTNPVVYTEYENFLGSGHANIPSHISSLDLPSVGASATTLRARTNPSREEVSVPNFVYELKDLPGLYRDIMKAKANIGKIRSLGRAEYLGSGYYLSYQFGWKPLISDIIKLLSFQDSVDKRIVELNRLYSEKGLKRRLRLHHEVLHSQDSLFVDTAGGIQLTAIRNRITTRNRWGTIRWLPTSVPKDLRRQDLGRVARRLIFGVHQNGYTAKQIWNAIPWTWLIDWFGNVDEYLGAHSNVIPAAPSGPCNIMTHTVTAETWTRTDSFTMISGCEGTRTLETKERVQSSGTLSVRLPFMSSRQLSILGALALQRKR